MDNTEALRIIAQDARKALPVKRLVAEARGELAEMLAVYGWEHVTPLRPEDVARRVVEFMDMQSQAMEAATLEDYCQRFAAYLSGELDEYKSDEEIAERTAEAARYGLPGPRKW
jgi:regulator of extracellular matrix RemA (YlzA/DUF370 family)